MDGAQDRNSLATPTATPTRTRQKRHNSQAIARRRAGKRLAQVMARLGLDPRVVAKETDSDLITVANLATFTPHLSTIERLSIYLEAKARDGTHRAASTTTPRPRAAALAQRLARTVAADSDE